MLKSLCKLLLKLGGWKVQNDAPGELKRAVLVAAPHTSNWDYYYAQLTFFILGVNVRFTIKKEWLGFPFGWFLKRMGAIGIDREQGNKAHKISHTDAMANLFKQEEELVVMVTPEGTRARRETWKTGFYYIALQAHVPIALGYLDYKNKIAGIGKVIYPSGDIQKDMREIMAFYKDKTAKYPENFSIDVNY